MRRAHYNYLLALGLLSLVGCQPYDGSSSSSAGLFGASANMLVAVPSVSGTLTTTVGANSTLSVSFLTDQRNPIIGLSISGLSTLPSGWSASGAPTCTLAFTSSGCNLLLTYAPSAVTHGTLTLSYRYSSKFGGIHSDSLTIPYAATTDNNVVASAAPGGAVNAVLGSGSQSVAVTFTTDDGNAATNFSLTSDLSSLPSGWTSSGTSFSCASLASGNGCQLPLTYAPSSVGSGILTLNYSYIDNAGQSKTGALNIPYASTSSNNVVGTASPSGQIAVSAGGNQSVAVTFTTDDGNAATALALTSDLSSLPSGWTSSAPSFSCASVSTGNGCQLALTYAPSAVASGTLSLAYTYTDNAGEAKTGYVNIPYIGTTHDHVIGTASPSGQLSVSVNASQAVSVTFTTDDGNAATNFSLTSDLSSLPSGWTSGAGSFSCASVSTGSGCQLSLTYAPPAAATGTLNLNYSYTNNAGTVMSGTVNIPYVASAGIGGAVSGLSGTLVLQDNGGDNLSLSSNGSFTFATPLEAGAPYSVSVLSQPTGQTCTVASGSGTVSTDVSNVAVSCTVNTYSIGGTISGLTQSGLALTDNGGDSLSPAAGATSFTFATPLAYGSGYAVAVSAQPTGETCTVASGSGTATGTVTSVAISCAINPYSIGGSISGLTQSGLMLTDNGGNATSIPSGSSSFTFSNQIAYGSGYAVAVSAQPTGETCTVASGSGTVTGTVASVAISCSTNTYSIGGSISGLTQSGLMLTDNGGNATPIASGSTSFTFSNHIAYGNTYSVAVSAQPTGETCTVASGSGTVSGTVSNVSISCVNVYTIGGTISGLTMSSVVLATGSQTVTVSHTASSWVFPTAVVSGTAYAVTVQTQPVGEVCEVTAGASGTVSGANVSNVTVVCGFALWTWEGGSSGENVTGVYGTKGTPSASNVPGGRQAVANWTDSSGNLWLFGGNGYDSAGSSGWLNDLWEYSPSSGKWTWMSGSNTIGAAGYYGTKGTPSSSTVPGARSRLSSWIDSSGNLWLFGGNNGSVSFNDLWEYSPASGEWTWVSGSSSANASGVYGTKGTASSSNVPGARDLSVSWIDSSGHLWLFGGSGYDSAGNSGNLNDLWEYSPSSGQWTWVSGSNVRNADGVYGTQGTPAAGNVPGARSGAARWIDSSGNLWLFGGAGYDATGGLGNLNDLWEYSPSSGEWTWVSGGSGDDTYGVYGTQGTAAASNMPGSRWNSATWVDPSGNLWLFGGPGYGATSNGWLNDLWEYSPSSGEWTWIGGSSTLNAAGVYGTQGTAATGNVPGADQSPASWVDASGHLWLFGGTGDDAADASGYLNSLWQASVP